MTDLVGNPEDRFSRAAALFIPTWNKDCQKSLDFEPASLRSSRTHRNQHIGLFVHLFDLILNVPVNSYGHVGTLPPFYGSLTKLRTS